MHTCSPPCAALEAWLSGSTKTAQRFGHLLLEQISQPDESIVEALRPYFESAHLDAREYFHRQVAISLHPDADEPGEHACYPSCLPSTARRGLFGEVMAGMITEAYQSYFVGGHQWQVPIFLFRCHADVEAYLWALARDPTRQREIFGRFGSDFIGLALGDGGEIMRVIVGEAKWRASLIPSAFENLMHGPKEENDAGEMVRTNRGVWFEVNRDTAVPHGLRQLQRLLEQREPNGYAATIVSIDKAVALNGPPLPRTNLILISGNAAKTRQAKQTLIQIEPPPPEYRSQHDLQIVELILENGEDLIEKLYDKLWKGVQS